jgi:hypothetical protein
MSAIKLGPFGGLSPSIDPRNLDPDGAQVARNLNLRFGDFRPLKAEGDPIATVVSGAKSVHKTPSGVWLSSADDVNYVNGQINDSEDERVYLTGRSAYPEVWQDNEYRRLGVPKPASAPTAVVNVTDEFTESDAAGALETVISAIVSAAVDNSTALQMGSTPTPTTPTSSISDTDPGDDIGSWTISPLVNSGGTYSEVSASTWGGNPSYLMTYDEIPGTGGAPYMFKDYGVENATSLHITVDFTPTDSSDVMQGVLVAQATQGGAGVMLFATGGAGGVLRLIKADEWGVLFPYPGTTLDTDTMISGFTSGHTYILDLTITVNGDGTSTVTGLCKDGGTTMGTVTYTGTFPRGDYIGLAAGDYANAASRYKTHYQNLVVTGSVNSGFWLEAGTNIGSPTLPGSSAGAWNYLGRMTGADMFTENEDYLQDGTLGGRKVYYGSPKKPWWAVPVEGYEAVGLDLNESAFRAAMEAIEYNATPLLTADLMDVIEADVTLLFDVDYTILAAMLATLEVRKASLNTLISSYAGTTGTTSSKVTAFRSAVLAVKSAAADIAAYFDSMSVTIRQLLNNRYSSAISALLPDVVTRNVETIAYVYTYVTDRGEESAPSAPSDLIERDQNDTSTVTGVLPPVDRHIVGWRLYRSSTTNVGGGAYQLHADKDAANAVLSNGEFDYYSTSSMSVEDTLRQEELQESLQTLTWAEPPDGLVGLVGLPNGVMAGFVGKTLCLCEPFRPYAWPEEYKQTLEFNIVGLGVFGQTVVVITEGNPYYASGADSASMSAQKIESEESGVSKRAIASANEGVFYPSPHGLCRAGPTGVSMLTGAAFTSDDWIALGVADSFAAFADGVYYLCAPGIADGVMMFDVTSKRIGTLEVDAPP